MLTAFHIPHLPATLIPKKRWSEDEFFDFCQKNQILRIERSAKGEILLMSPAGAGSGRKNSSINGQLWVWSEAQGLGLSFDSSTGFTLPDGSMRSPDGAWLSHERWNALTPRQQSRFAPVCPEFVIELRSPSDSLKSLRRKMPSWLANGAQLGWLIDPLTRTVEIYRPGREPELLQEPAIVHGEGPIAGFTLTMRSIWS